MYNSGIYASLLSRVNSVYYASLLPVYNSVLRLPAPARRWVTVCTAPSLLPVGANSVYYSLLPPARRWEQCVLLSLLLPVGG